MDAKEGKVQVVGSVDPAELIKKLKKLGKHAEILDSINKQLQNLQVDNNSKGSNGNKSHNQNGPKESNGNKSHNHNGPKENNGGGAQAVNLQNLEEGRDIKIPSKQPKSVKSNLHNLKFDSIDDCSHHELHHINFDDDCGEEGGEGHLHGHGHQMENISGPRGPAGMMNSGPFRSQDNGCENDGTCKKDENQMEGKNGNTQNGKSDGGFLSQFLVCGKNSQKEQVVDSYKKNYNHNNDDKKEKNSCNNLERQESVFQNASGSKSKNSFDFVDYYNVPSEGNGRYGRNGNDSNGNGNMGQMGPMEHNIRAVQEQQGPTKNSGRYDQQGMQMQMEHPSYEQQQQQQQKYQQQQEQRRMDMMRMMKQQQQFQQQQQQQQRRRQQEANYGNNMFPSNRMYDRAHPSMNYRPPPPLPPSTPSPVKHTCSEENAAGCTIV